MKYIIRFEEMDYVLKSGSDDELDRRYSGFRGLSKATPENKEEEEKHKYEVRKEIEASSVSELLDKIYNLYKKDNDIHAGETYDELHYSTFGTWPKIEDTTLVPATQKDEYGKIVNEDEDYFGHGDGTYYDNEGNYLEFWRVSIIKDINEVCSEGSYGNIIYICPSEEELLDREQRYLNETAY